MSPRPVLLGCRGGSPLSQLVGELVADLDEAGVAEAAADPADVPARRDLLVVDGCGSGCMTRLLAAEGRAPAARVDLAALGVAEDALDALDRATLVERLAQLLQERRPAAPARVGRPETPHGPPLARANDADDYLLALDALTSPVVECGALAQAPTRSAHVARTLGISRAACGEMLAKLEQDGLLQRGPQKEIVLTARGRAEADAAVRRHRLLERFAVDVLGYDLDEAYARAASLRPAFDADALARLRRVLGEPERCPHGWLLDAAAAREESAALLAADALAAGDEALVVRLSELDAAAARRLAAAGLVPGARLVARGGGTLEVEGRLARVAPRDLAALHVLRPPRSACAHGANP